MEGTRLVVASLAALLGAFGCRGEAPPHGGMGGRGMMGMRGGAQELPEGADPRGTLFYAKGCPQCHAISALGIASATDAGPDLSNAATDVPERYGVPLAEFLRNPTGTMQIVLGSQIRMTAAERDSLVTILEQLSSP